MFLLILAYIIFICLNRNKKVIIDEGFKNNFIFPIGMIFYFISLLFITNENSLYCSLHFLFKNIGISLALSVYYVDVTLAIKLGKKRKTPNKGYEDDEDTEDEEDDDSDDDDDDDDIYLNHKEMEDILKTKNSNLYIKVRKTDESSVSMAMFMANSSWDSIDYPDSEKKTSHVHLKNVKRLNNILENNKYSLDSLHIPPPRPPSTPLPPSPHNDNNNNSRYNSYRKSVTNNNSTSTTQLKPDWSSLLKSSFDNRSERFAERPESTYEQSLPPPLPLPPPPQQQQQQQQQPSCRKSFKPNNSWISFTDFFEKKRQSGNKNKTPATKKNVMCLYTPMDLQGYSNDDIEFTKNKNNNHNNNSNSPTNNINNKNRFSFNLFRSLNRENKRTSGESNKSNKSRISSKFCSVLEDPSEKEDMKCMSLTTSESPVMSASFRKKLKSVHTLFLEIVFIEFLTILIIMLMAIFYERRNKDGNGNSSNISHDDDYNSDSNNNNNNNNNSGNIFQDSNGKFFHRCELEKSEMMLNLVYFVLFLFLFQIVKPLLSYELIFKSIKYINYATYIVVVFGPVANLFSYFFFYNQRYVKTFFDFAVNYVCYTLLFLLYAFGRVYVIVKGKGDDSNAYFIFKRHDLCQVHHSTVCGCRLNTHIEGIKSKNEKYISVYRMCSNFFLNLNNPINTKK